MADSKKSTTRRKKAVRKNVGLSVVHILSSFNNTQVTVTDSVGNVLAWGTAGAQGFKGARKSTPYAATQVTTNVLEKVKPMGITAFEIKVSGIGTGRDAALRAFSASGVPINTIIDVTPLPHNGCRPKKARRV
jgi:small subunit ribosomal protein S11